MSSLELVMYFPILMFVVFLTVQFSFVYLGNQAASAAARQAARVGKVTHVGPGCAGNAPQAEANGRAYAEQIGRGLLKTVQVDVQYVQVDGLCQVRATVTGTGIQLVPGSASNLRRVSQGPVEEFRGD